MLSKPIRFPTSELYTAAKVVTVRQLFILKVVLRKHLDLPFVKMLQNDGLAASVNPIPLALLWPRSMVGLITQ
jgi:hypothetical protein